MYNLFVDFMYEKYANNISQQPINIHLKIKRRILIGGYSFLVITFSYIRPSVRGVTTICQALSVLFCSLTWHVCLFLLVIQSVRMSRIPHFFIKLS